MASKTETANPSQLMHKRNYEVFRCWGSYPGEKSLHYHDFYEVSFILSGNANYKVDDRIYHLTAGDVFFVGPMEPHQPVQSPENQNEERIELWIEKGYLRQFTQLGSDLTACFDTTVPWHTSQLRPDSVSGQMLGYMFDQLLRESQAREFGSDLYAQSYLVQAMILINRLAEHDRQQPELRDKTSSLVMDVLNYINENYNEDLSLDFLANKFFISKYHLSREFNRLVGTSVYRYIIQKRLAVAKLLMRQGEPSTAVYQQCGFGDYSNFYRAFKAEYRMSPKQFSDSLKENMEKGNL